MKFFIVTLLAIFSLYTSPVIVSFTTTSERIEKSIPMINSILSQSLKPDQFILNLSLHPYPNSTDEGFAHKKIPPVILEYEKKGILEIHFVRNLGPLKKLGPILQKQWENKDCMIVTCDDDIIYPSHWLQSLVERSLQYPDHLIATAVHLHRLTTDFITDFSKAPRVRMQRDLKKKKMQKYNFFHLLTGYGMLVKPRFFSEAILDFDKFLRFLPFEDDFFVSAEIFNQKVPVILSDIPHKHYSHIKMREEDKIWATKHREGKINTALKIMKDKFINF